MDKNGNKAVFQMKQQLLLIDKYRNGVKKGVQTRVQERIKRLENSASKEIYLERKFKAKQTGKVTSDIKELFSH